MRQTVHDRCRVRGDVNRDRFHIDIYHLQKHYRLEQGYTYELNLYGDGGAAREEFVAGTRIVTRDSDR